MSEQSRSAESFAAVESRLQQLLLRRKRGRLGDLEERPGWTATGDARPAAVLLLLERVPGYRVVLTKRTDHVEHHKGEISLAGGMADPGDTDAEHTALREAHEELAVEPRHVDVLGRLDALLTVTGFEVTPVVGCIDADYPMQRQEAEVERILRVPLTTLRDPNAWFEDVRTWRGRQYTLHSCRHGDDVIWGATSRILQHFLAVVPPGLL